MTRRKKQAKTSDVAKTTSVIDPVALTQVPVDNYDSLELDLFTPKEPKPSMQDIKNVESDEDYIELEAGKDSPENTEETINELHDRFLALTASQQKMELAIQTLEVLKIEIKTKEENQYALNDARKVLEDEAKNYSYLYNQYKTEINKLESQATSLNSYYEESNREHTNTKEALSKADEERLTILKTLNEQEAFISDKEDQLANLEGELNDLNNKSEDLKSCMTSLEKEIKSLGESLKSHETRQANLVASSLTSGKTASIEVIESLEKIKLSIKEVSTEIAGNNKLLDKAQQDLANISIGIIELNQSFSTISHELEAALLSKEIILSSLEEVTKKIEETNNYIELREEKLEKITQEIQSILGQKEEYEAYLKKTVSNRVDTAKKISSLNIEEEHLTAEIKKLEEEVLNSNNSIGFLREDIAAKLVNIQNLLPENALENYSISTQAEEDDHNEKSTSTEEDTENLEHDFATLSIKPPKEDKYELVSFSKTNYDLVSTAQKTVLQLTNYLLSFADPIKFLEATVSLTSYLTNKANIILRQTLNMLDESIISPLLTTPNKPASNSHEQKLLESGDPTTTEVPLSEELSSFNALGGNSEISDPNLQSMPAADEILTLEITPPSNEQRSSEQLNDLTLGEESSGISVINFHVPRTVYPMLTNGNPLIGNEFGDARLIPLLIPDFSVINFPDLSKFTPDISKTITWEVNKLLYPELAKKANSLIVTISETDNVDSLKDRKFMTKVHPDTNPGNVNAASNTAELNQIRDRLNQEITKSLSEKATELIKTINQGIVGLSIIDEGVEVVRLVNNPSYEQASITGLKGLYLVTLYVGNSALSYSLSGAKAAYNLYQGDYTSAITNVATSVGFYALSCAKQISPEASLAINSVIFVASAISTAANVYELCNEMTETKPLGAIEAPEVLN